MNAAGWAERYVERLGLALTPLRGKRAFLEGWQLDVNLLRTPGAAREYFSRNPRDNMGACLEPSGLVSVDADDPDGARLVLAAEGIDLDALMASTPTIIGRAPRLEFKAPTVPLGRKSVAWPPKAAGEMAVTVVELRAGRVQDVLPPSIHPGTKEPYRWITSPRNGFPPLPESLLTLWQNFDAFKHRARNLCPWADPEPEPTPPQPRAPARERTGPSVIDAFNEAHDAVAILEAHGYQRIAKRRWKSPNGHGLGGVVVLPSGKVFCHHQSDALGNGRAHDAFDLFRIFDHGGDYRAAVKAAASLGKANGHH
jgi:putative DNA primase/helicase